MNALTPTATSSPQPVRTAARCAIVTLALAGIAWVVRAIWEIRLSVAGMPASGPPAQGNGQHRPLTALEDSYHIVSALGDACVVLCAIAFLMWLFRVRDNAQILSGRPPQLAWPWVYLGWIIPIVNLWMPRGIVADVHHASAPGERLPRAVNWWWGLWLVAFWCGAGQAVSGSRDDAIDRAYTGARWLLAGDAATVAAAVAGIFVVRALTDAQQRRINH
ncbi:DUF4328 domain-containing protein [Streptomyces sp. NPDC056149]|uniref:DUF4328 domain-containing protein n=1 Tax=Streptomyces sp. NPDC056149 TaxID=3345728 RepID=UPI0035DD6D6B